MPCQARSTHQPTLRCSYKQGITTETSTASLQAWVSEGSPAITVILAISRAPGSPAIVSSAGNNPSSTRQRADGFADPRPLTRHQQKLHGPLRGVTTLWKASP